MQLVCEQDLELLKPGAAIGIELAIEPDVVTIRPAAYGTQGTHQLVSVCGLPFVTHLSEHDEVISRTLQTEGVWEALESTLLLGVIRPGMTFVDVGANIGYYTTLLARCLGTQGAVYAFEPEPRNFEILTANVLLAKRFVGTIPSMYFESRAVSDAVGQAAFSVFPQNLGFHSLEVHEGTGARRWVHTITLDRLRGFESEFEPVIRHRIDLIKADVQGAELRVLRGARQTIEQDRPMLCLEFEPYLTGDRHCFELLDWLLERGYRDFQLFHSNCDKARDMVHSLAHTISADQIRKSVIAKQVGAYGTLFTTYPDTNRSAAKRCEMGASPNSSHEST